ncbi:protease HtpX [Virgibacillus pantothenticus]|uniref:Protease HtpX n=1 Tax=Virgibacillus pantothenticus TaxID=1473 RepID=A0A0L0QRX6_VIRPA|nr:protease HtpX [Virgibacillus pantothenticus]KNE21405.1 protease HtpX [Virgibacillus pantothenticus]MED3737616.1 protease HtpX [Virgibacillus pantothenticus]QTY16169.1 protease HtpX [Virgibacillus pantothenticus]SIS71177.1 heat shock protein HtpX [Virgibacillus pantothenticus]
MGKRIFYFILTNVLVLVTISIIFMLIPGTWNYIGEDGQLQLGTLLIFSAIIGFTGSFLSLGLSRWMAKKMMGVHVLDPNDNLSQQEREIVDTVHRLSRSAGLMHMPEVGIYDAKEVNAFATGPSKKRSLIAVSSGLLHEMDGDAMEGVIAHEVAHIANGDMVTMTLLQGVVNTFVVFLARIAAFIVTRFVKEELAPIVHFLAILFFQIIFSVLGSLIVFAYSRHREFHADRGGADLAGKDKMRHALEALKMYSSRVREEEKSIATLKINGNKKASIFSTHPSLDERIHRLS